jgi:hypothetical protein
VIRVGRKMWVVGVWGVAPRDLVGSCKAHRPLVDLCCACPHLTIQLCLRLRGCFVLPRFCHRVKGGRGWGPANGRPGRVFK